MSEEIAGSAGGLSEASYMPKYRERDSLPFDESPWVRVETSRPDISMFVHSIFIRVLRVQCVYLRGPLAAQKSFLLSVLLPSTYVCGKSLRCEGPPSPNVLSETNEAERRH